jgi:hypothetical protein
LIEKEHRWRIGFGPQVSDWNKDCTGTGGNHYQLSVQGLPMPLPYAIFVSNDFLIRFKLELVSEPFLLGMLGIALFFAGSLIHRWGNRNHAHGLPEPTMRESTIARSSLETRLRETSTALTSVILEQSYDSRAAGLTVSAASWITLTSARDSDERSPALLGN